MKAVLFSGGVDSLIHLRWAERRFGRELQPIYFDVGQCYLNRELNYARRLAETCHYDLKVIPLSSLHEDRKTGHIPMRNLFFLLQCAASTEPEYDGVVFGMLKAESSEDKNKGFVRHVQALIDTQFEASMYRKEKKEFTIYTPFDNMTKTQMIRWYLHKGYPAYMLRQTVACYTPEGDMCGECISCFNRWLAFDRVGLTMEKFKIHPAASMIGRLITMHEKSDSEDWKAVGWSKAWHRRQWAWETYQALNEYSRKEYGKGVLKFVLESGR